MPQRHRLAIALALTALVAAPGARAADVEPPFSGTIFLDPDIITPSDPTTYTGLRFKGRGKRTVFDRRADADVTIRAFLFAARYSDEAGRTEVVVNPEFRKLRAATKAAKKYSRVVGQLPAVLRETVSEIVIHRGVEPFGGGFKGLLIHTGQSAEYERDGILEETLVHEASHTSLDPTHFDAPGWRAAQKADPTFISTYARDFPDREDVAESFLPWFAVRHRADRITPELKAQIEQTIPNRLAYFDEQAFALGPQAR
jgi:hypothetical protein